MTAREVIIDTKDKNGIKRENGIFPSIQELNIKCIWVKDIKANERKYLLFTGICLSSVVYCKGFYGDWT